MTVLEGPASAAPPDADWEGRLYREAEGVRQGDGEPVRLTAIPYFAWANREAGRMQVWLREPPPR